ncbi:unnamed protein product, partial [Bubo scandiacus]
MAEPGRMEVPADPSFSGPTEERMLQVPAPITASSVPNSRCEAIENNAKLNRFFHFY